MLDTWTRRVAGAPRVMMNCVPPARLPVMTDTALRGRSNHHFYVLDFHWLSPEFGDFCYKTRLPKKRI